MMMMVVIWWLWWWCFDDNIHLDVMSPWVAGYFPKSADMMALEAVHELKMLLLITMMVFYKDDGCYDNDDDWKRWQK